MLEKYLKMLFSFKLKKNINVLLIIFVLLILTLLFFGNSNLIEGNVECKYNCEEFNKHLSSMMTTSRTARLG